MSEANKPEANASEEVVQQTTAEASDEKTFESEVDALKAKIEEEK